MNRFGRSLWICHLEFYKEAISDSFMAYLRVFRGGGLSNFKEQGFCGPCFCSQDRKMHFLSLAIDTPELKF